MRRKQQINHAEPAYSLRETPGLFMITGRGTYDRVGKIPAGLFAHLVKQCARTAKDPEACNQALEKHDYAEMYDRWHAILVLLEHKCTVPVARYAVDDRNSKLNNNQV